MKKTNKVLGTIMCLAGAVCASLGLAACNDDKDSHEHSYSESWSYDKNNLDLGHWHDCTVDGCNQVADTAAHTWDNGTTAKEATCIEDGEVTYKCTVCDATKTETVQKTGNHTLSAEWSKDSTGHWHSCTTEGCTNKDTVVQHTYGNWETVTPATEESKGSEKRTCTACNYEDTRDINKLPHTHKYSDVWSSDGNEHWHAATCDDTDATNSKSDVAVHDYKDWVVTKQPTEDEEGTKERECKVCKYKQTDTVAKLNHSHNYDEEQWAKDSSGHWHECDGCTEKVALAQHNYGNWTVKVQPTETGVGTRERECAVCHYTDTAELPALTSADYTKTEDNATCTSAGEIVYTYNKNGVSVSFKVATPAKGHDWATSLSRDNDYHWIECLNDATHVKPDSKVAHTENLSDTYTISYTSSDGKWKKIHTVTCDEDCGHTASKVTAEYSDGGEGADLSTAMVGKGTRENPYLISASNSVVHTVTVPANTVLSLRYTNLGAGGIFSVMPIEGDNLSVIYGNRVENVGEGQRAKSNVYIGDRGGSLDFALTTTDGAEATIKFKFFDNGSYYLTGNPSTVAVDTEYTDELPEETDIVHQFAPTKEGLYTFTVTDGSIYLEDSSNLISAGNSFTEPLYEKVYKLTVTTNWERTAGTVKFKIEYAGEIPEPALGSQKNPIVLNGAGDYEVEIEQGTYYAYGKFYAFTPSDSGYYIFYDVNSDIATYNLYSDSSFLNDLARTIDFGGRDYSYIECELSAGVTYYLRVSSNENKAQTVNMKIELHEHTFKDEWVDTDPNSHWHEASCGHEVKRNVEGHTYNVNNVCEVCGYEKVEKVTEGLLFELSTDETYYIVSVGSATDTEIYIPETYGADNLPVKEIATNGFKNKATITSITIPSTITKINSNAFQNCSAITAIYITDLEAWAQIEFGNNYANPFYHYAYLNGACSDETVIYLNGEPVKNVNLDVSVSNYAFINCSSIQSVTLSGASVGNYNFSYCANINALTLNEGVQEICTYAFYGTPKITQLNVPSTLTAVGSSAFGTKKTTAGVSIQGPQISKLTVTDLASYAQTDWGVALLTSAGKIYSGDNEVTELNASELNITKIGSYTFQNASIASVNLTGVTELKASAFKDSKITRVDIDSLNSWLGITFGLNSNPLSSETQLYINNELVTSLTITGTVPDYAFYNYAALTRVDLSGVTEIGASAFYGTGLTSVEISNATIGSNAFVGSNITKVVLNNVETVSAAFGSCKQLTTVIIGEGTKTISANAFKNCTALTTLVLPKSLATLTNTALSTCTALTNIYFLGTSEADLLQDDGTTAKAWTTVASVKNKTMYFYSEEEPTTAGNFWHYVDGVPTAYPAVEE